MSPETAVFTSVRTVAFDETWRGETRLEADLVIAPGALLTLEAGAALLLASGARVIVRGRLVATGAPAAPVRLAAAGSAWGGLRLIERGSARLDRVELSGVAGDGFLLIDDSDAALRDVSIQADGRFAAASRSTGTLTLERCLLSGGNVGLSAMSGSLLARDCSLRRQGEASLELGCEARLERVSAEGAALALKVAGGRVEAEALELAGGDGARVIGPGFLRWTGGVCRAAGAALTTEQARADLAGVTIAGGERGAALQSGRLEARDCRWDGQSALGVWCSPEGSARLSGCSFRGAPTAVSALGPVELQDCRLEGHETGLDLHGAGHAAARTTIAACRLALALDGAAGLEDVDVGGCEQGGRLVGRSDLRWRGGTCAVSRAGLTVEGGRAAVSGVSFSGGERGAAMLAGRLEAETCRFEGQSELGVWCAPESSARLSGCAFRGAPTAVSALGPVELSECRLASHDTGLDLHGPGHAAARVTISGCRVSVALDGAASLAGVAIEGGGDGVTLVGGSDLRWLEGTCAVSRRGLTIEGGRAFVRAVAFSAGERGAALRSGRLEAEGCRFEGQSEQGLWCSAEASARLSGCAFRGAPTAISAGGPAELEDCRFESHGTGLDLHGPGHAAARTTLAGCGVAVALDGAAVFSGVQIAGGGDGVRLVGGSQLSWRDGSCAVARSGLTVEGGSASLRRVSFSGGERGAALEAGRLDAEESRFSGQAELAVWCASAATARLASCELAGSPIGVAARGPVALERCRLSAHAREGLDLQGRGHRVAATSLSQCGVAAALAGEAAFEAVSAQGEQLAAVAHEGSSLEWRGGSLSGPCALRADRARVVLDGARVSGGADAVRLEGGSLLAEGLEVRAGAHGFVVESGGFLDVSRTSVSADVGFAALSGHLHVREDVSVEGCREALSAGSGAVACVKARPARAPSGPRASALAFVLATRGSRPWRRLYRLAYAAAAGAASLRLSLWRGVAAARFHRGWASAEWEPGVSDLDLLVVADRLSGEAGAAWLRRLWRRYAAWKRLVPFLGEALVAERSEVAAFVRHGGARAAETAERLPGPWPAPAEVDADARLLERLHAYTRLVQCCFDAASEPWDRNARQAAKCYLDVLRLEGAGPSPSRRAQAEALLRGAPDGRRRALESLTGTPREPLAALGAAAGEALAALHASAVSRAADDGGPQDARAPERVSGDSQLEILADAFGPGVVGLLSDDLSRSFVVLSDEAAAPERLARALCSCAAGQWLRPTTLPLPMTAPLWRAFARLPYLEDPTRRLGFDGDGPLAARAAGHLLPSSRQTAWGVCRRTVAVGHAEAQAAARRAAAVFALTWRWQGCRASGADPRAVFHHLLSRGLGLKLLLQRGLALPFFDLDGLVARAALEFPPLAPELARLRPLREGASLEEAFFPHYALVDRLSRDAVAAASAPAGGG